jgi:hypothetical protein
MSNSINLTRTECNILKTASEKSQHISKSAKKFRELLINRGCITSLTTVREFMSNENLMSAIKLNWLLGYSDNISSDNLSKGIVSDYDLLQIPPSNNDSIKINDEETIKKLTKIRLNERRTMMRNIDTFIRNMGWVEEEEVEHKTKKRAIVKKDEVIEKVDNLLDNSSIASSLVLTESLSSPSDNLTTMEMTDQESNDYTHVPVLKLPDVINIDDERSEVTDSVEIECKKYLKKMLTENGDVCGIIAYVDNDGDVEMKVIDTNVLTRVMELMNMNIMNEDDDDEMKA